MIMNGRLVTLDFETGKFRWPLGGPGNAIVEADSLAEMEEKIAAIDELLREEPHRKEDTNRAR